MIHGDRALKEDLRARSVAQLGEGLPRKHGFQPQYCQKNKRIQGVEKYS